MKEKKFPYRISVGFTKEHGKYLDALVQKKYFDSQSQAVRYFIDQFEGHILNLRKHGFDCALPLMSDILDEQEKAARKK